MMSDKFAKSQPWNILIERSRRVMLHPLAKIVVGVFMAVAVGGGQFMMDILRDCERRKCQQQDNKTDREAGF